VSFRLKISGSLLNDSLSGNFESDLIDNGGASHAASSQVEGFIPDVGCGSHSLQHDCGVFRLNLEIL